jgi:hypothetical protein
MAASDATRDVAVARSASATSAPTATISRRAQRAATTADARNATRETAIGNIGRPRAAGLHCSHSPPRITPSKADPLVEATTMAIPTVEAARALIVSRTEALRASAARGTPAAATQQMGCIRTAWDTSSADPRMPTHPRAFRKSTAGATASGSAASASRNVHVA